MNKPTAITLAKELNVRPNDVLQLAHEVGVRRTSIAASFAEAQAVRIRAHFAANYESCTTYGSKPVMRRKRTEAPTLRPKAETGLTHRISDDWPIVQPEPNDEVVSVEQTSFTAYFLVDPEDEELAQIEVRSVDEIPAEIEIAGVRYRAATVEAVVDDDDGYEVPITFFNVHLAEVEGASRR